MINSISSTVKFNANATKSIQSKSKNTNFNGSVLIKGGVFKEGFTTVLAAQTGCSVMRNGDVITITTPKAKLPAQNFFNDVRLCEKLLKGSGLLKKKIALTTPQIQPLLDKLAELFTKAGDNKVSIEYIPTPINV